MLTYLHEATFHHVFKRLYVVYGLVWLFNMLTISLHLLVLIRLLFSNKVRDIENEINF